MPTPSHYPLPTSEGTHTEPSPTAQAQAERESEASEDQKANEAAEENQAEDDASRMPTHTTGEGQCLFWLYLLLVCVDMKTV